MEAASGRPIEHLECLVRGGGRACRFYGYDDRLIVGRDRFGRPVSYRQMPRNYADDYRNGYNRDMSRNRQVRCNSNGKCKVTYYDPSYDRNGRRYDNRSYSYEHRRWHNNHRRWHDDNDD